MALIIPFQKATFAADFKSKFSGANVTLEFANVESSLAKIGADISDLIGLELYEAICAATAALTPAIPAVPATETDPEIPEVPANSETTLNAEAKDLLQRSMINLAMYEHTIYLITRIGNDGVTQKKNEDEAPIYKYQKEQLENKMIKDGWFWMNRLIRLLDKYQDKFAVWKNSDAQKAINEVPVKIEDFKKWLGINDEYFMLNASGIIREVWNECIASREKSPTKNDDIARAVCYEVLARACTRLSYYCLPEPIRLDINNEMGKDHASQSDTYIREKVANIFHAKAEAYFTAYDFTLANKATEETTGRVSTEPYRPSCATERDSFYYS